jgi:uncharacterized protein
MSTTLLASALLLGLGGSPHCAAMCGVACGGVTGHDPRRRLMFHTGRVAGYVTAGAVAGAAAQGLGWLAGQTAALRPVWVLFHLAVLAWGLSLLVLARQPAWVDGAARAAWRRVQPMSGQAVFVAGALWTLLPCGLLWSALLVASLTGGPLEGAAAMALFAAATLPGLTVWPALLDRLRLLGRSWGTRLAGLLVTAGAAWGLGMEVAHRVSQWCE